MALEYNIGKDKLLLKVKVIGIFLKNQKFKGDLGKQSSEPQI